MSGSNGRKRLLLVALSVGLAVACTERTERKVDQAQKSASEAMARTADAAGSAARDVGEATRDAGAELAASAKNAAEATKDAVKEGGRVADAALETLDVKSALMADRSVDASRIDVDTDHGRKLVVLKGWVKTAAERDAAGRIAAHRAEGYHIDNQLKLDK